MFPGVRARNLEGLDVELPGGFVGERNVVVIAFQRNHQSFVDSWVPWLDEQAAVDPGLRFYEVPTIGRMCGTSSTAAWPRRSAYPRSSNAPSPSTAT